MPRGVKFVAKLDSRKARGALAIVRQLGLEPVEFLDAVGGILEASVRHRFDTSQGPGGVPWVPSRRVLHAADARGPIVGGNGKTLVDKGNLERSLRHEVRGHTLLVGFDGQSESVKHAAAHQFGSHRQTVVVSHLRVIDSAFGVPLREVTIVKVRPHSRMTNLPARPMLGVDQQDRSDVKDALRGLLVERLK